MTLNTVIQDFHKTYLWWCITLPSFIKKCLVVQKIRQTFNNILNFAVTLTLTVIFFFFCLFLRTLSNQVWLQKVEWFKRYHLNKIQTNQQMDIWTDGQTDKAIPVYTDKNYQLPPSPLQSFPLRISKESKEDIQEKKERKPHKKHSRNKCVFCFWIICTLLCTYSTNFFLKSSLA